MTEDRMALVELLQKSGDPDFLRAVAKGGVADPDGSRCRRADRGRPVRAQCGAAELPQRLPRPHLLRAGVPLLPEHAAPLNATNQGSDGWHRAT
jgi:hypothetical protein